MTSNRQLRLIDGRLSCAALHCSGERRAVFAARPIRVRVCVSALVARTRTLHRLAARRGWLSGWCDDVSDRERAGRCETEAAKVDAEASRELRRRFFKVKHCVCGVVTEMAMCATR